MHIPYSTIIYWQSASSSFMLKGHREFRRQFVTAGNPWEAAKKDHRAPYVPNITPSVQDAHCLFSLSRPGVGWTFRTPTLPTEDSLDWGPDQTQRMGAYQEGHL